MKKDIDSILAKHDKMNSTQKNLMKTFLMAGATEKDAIEKVQGYEESHFDKVITDLSDPEKLANMLYYIIGEEIINDLELVDCDDVDDAIKLVKEALEREAGE